MRILVGESAPRMLYAATVYKSILSPLYAAGGSNPHLVTKLQPNNRHANIQHNTITILFFIVFESPYLRVVATQGVSVVTRQEPSCFVRLQFSGDIFYHTDAAASIEEPFSLFLHRYRHRRQGMCYRKRKEFFGSMKKRMDYAILSGFCAYQRNALRS